MIYLHRAAPLQLLRDTDANVARSANHRAEKRVARRLESAFLDRSVEVRELVVSELLEHLRQKRERGVDVRVGEDGLERAELADVSYDVGPSQQRAVGREGELATPALPTGLEIAIGTGVPSPLLAEAS